MTRAWHGLASCLRSVLGWGDGEDGDEDTGEQSGPESRVQVMAALCCALVAVAIKLGVVPFPPLEEVQDGIAHMGAQQDGQRREDPLSGLLVLLHGIRTRLSAEDFILLLTAGLLAVICCWLRLRSLVYRYTGVAL